MRPASRTLASAVVCALAAAAVDRAASPVEYRLSFPDPPHRWMQVDATFPDLPTGPLELRISQSSPGRYALHEFAKNVYDVHVRGEGGAELPTTRPDPSGWRVAEHPARVTVTYKVFGDRIDGTYLAVDETHAHINMPAAIMWARGLDDRPVSMTFAPPPGAAWSVATQLHPAGSLAFTAPNLQYLMDSPTEFGPVSFRTFEVDGSTFRIGIHHTGTDADLDGYTRDVEKVVAAEERVFGEFPKYEPGTYTFILDYVPYASGDGMEHRNSTFITSGGTIAANRGDLLDALAHEFFHCWNVERIRPQGLEPFDFDRANMTDSLWLAEGFTQYYGPLSLARAGLMGLPELAGELAGLIDSVTLSPAHELRSAVDMSRMAPFIDGARYFDRTNFPRTVISYYPFGGAIALALDLSLRERSAGRVTLDDFMRAMWRAHGKPGGSREGYVDRPYSLQDAEARLADVSDPAFAREFFGRYIEGHDVADYRRLLAPAGFELRDREAGHAWLGDVFADSQRGSQVAALVMPTWPVYAAGLEQDDEVRELDGQRIGGPADLAAVLRRHRPGDRVDLVYAQRSGKAVRASVTLAEDPGRRGFDVVPVESTGAALSPAQKAFRDRWLGRQ
ncbi:MAG TPA: PDZ domain-containing protein [Vicinamibacterales bacterium]|nr:PDZ domain-containing protein [Vicinamibacterales bacterium]